MQQSESLRSLEGILMAEMSREELLRAEAIGSEQGWVAPLTQED